MRKKNKQKNTKSQEGHCHYNSHNATCYLFLMEQGKGSTELDTKGYDSDGDMTANFVIVTTMHCVPSAWLKVIIPLKKKTNKQKAQTRPTMHLKLVPAGHRVTK